MSTPLPDKCLYKVPGRSRRLPLGYASPPQADGTTIRLYSQSECVEKIGGVWQPNGECLKPGGGSWSWECRGLNPPTQVTPTIVERSPNASSPNASGSMPPQTTMVAISPDASGSMPPAPMPMMPPPAPMPMMPSPGPMPMMPAANGPMPMMPPANGPMPMMPSPAPMPMMPVGNSPMPMMPVGNSPMPMMPPGNGPMPMMPTPAPMPMMPAGNSPMPMMPPGMVAVPANFMGELKNKLQSIQMSSRGLKEVLDLLSGKYSRLDQNISSIPASGGKRRKTKKARKMKKSASRKQKRTSK